jgi:mannose-6-phosphate isomerase-like protein (cupin superfamily)
MPDWAKTNFDEIEDTSPDGVSIDWRFARRRLGDGELGVSRFTFAPGERFPWAHRHREQEEAYVVVSGSGRIKLDEAVEDLAAGDVLRLGPAVARQIEAGPEGLEVICIGGRRPEGGDGEKVEGFWD